MVRVNGIESYKSKKKQSQNYFNIDVCTNQECDSKCRCITLSLKTKTFDLGQGAFIRRDGKLTKEPITLTTTHCLFKFYYAKVFSEYLITLIQTVLTTLKMLAETKLCWPNSTVNKLPLTIRYFGVQGNNINFGSIKEQFNQLRSEHHQNVQEHI